MLQWPSSLQQRHVPKPAPSQLISASKTWEATQRSEWRWGEAFGFQHLYLPLLMPDVFAKAECNFDLSLLCCKLTNYSHYASKVISLCKNTCLQTLPIQGETEGIAIKEAQRLTFIAALKVKNVTEWGHKPLLHWPLNQKIFANLINHCKTR